MKWIIYILLLVNLGVFVWHYQPGADVRRGHNQINDQLTRLVLLKEYEQQQKSTGQQGGAPRCFSLGPFTRRETLNQAREILQQPGIELFSRVSSERVRNGYWVMLPASDSNNHAKVLIQKLKERGVKDYFLVATGEMKNAISLGVFSKAKLAKRRSDEVKKLDFKVEIKKITLPKRVYWLEWSRTAEHQPDKARLNKLLGQFEGLGQTERRCQLSKKS